MGELILQAPVAGLTSRSKVTPEDVQMLRGEVFRDGVVTRAEAEALFAVDNSCTDKCPEWTEFFVEAIVDFIVHQEEPEGYISADNAKWLVRTISSDGMVGTEGEMEILVKVLEQAKSSPASLSAYALRQVAHAVIDGEGTLANGAQLTRGIIGNAETDLLRRILYAGGGEGHSGISREEAEVLFDLNDNTPESANAPEWTDLFVKAIANALMCASGYVPPSREEALHREEFFAEKDANVAGFLSRMVSGGLKAVFDAYQAPGGIENAFRARNEALEKADSEAEAIDGSEAKWLAERIGRDGVVRDNEKALLGFIRENSPNIHPELLPLFDKAS